MLKNIISVILFIGIAGILAFIPKEDNPIEKIVGSLQKWNEVNPEENVYLHMDKPYYALGDTIWFKAYLTIGSRHQPSAMSGALYVDLINEKDSLEQTLKLPVIAGMAIGDFVLGDDFKEGNYRVRAYTQWMRNAGEEFFYDHTFVVGNLIDNEVIAKVDYQYKIVDDKSVVIARLNYKDQNGNALTDKNVDYEIIANHKIFAQNNAKTDANGNISISIINDQKSDLKGAYIQTAINTIKRVKIQKSFLLKAALSKSDARFFPEGGYLINGIFSKVAFKAVGIDGSEMNVKGMVLDNENKEIIEFSTFHAGMGSFNLKPEAGKSYKAKVTYADGSETLIDLPPAVNEGYVLSLYQPDNDSLLIRINTSEGLLNAPQTVSLLVQSGAEVIYATQVEVDGPQTSIWLDKKQFPTGIAQVTLFDGKGEPLNERIAFIKNNDQMHLKLYTAKKTYRSKERVEVELESTDPAEKAVAGNFSVTVIDESKVPFDETLESTILSNILLTSDLKGYIEKPNYYFAKNSPEINKALDLLMLTQGYRKFIWKEVLKPGAVKPVYPAEKLTTEISGKVVTLGNKPVPHGNVTLFSLRGRINKDTVTDADGRFKFPPVFITDSVKFAVQGRTPKNGKKVEVILDKIPVQKLTKNKNIADINNDVTGTIKTYLENSIKQDQALSQMGKLGRVQRLREVVIKAKKLNKFSSMGAYRIPEGHADFTYIMEDPQHCATLAICLQGRLPGVVFQTFNGDCFVTNFPFARSYGRLVPMQVVIDGSRLSACEVADLFDGGIIDPADIIKIDVIRTNLALTSMLGGPTLLIYTRKGYQRMPRYNPSIVNITPKGFNKARQFYAPKYDKIADTQVSDFRSTIYWNSVLKTDEGGKAKFSFYNADGPGDYKIIVEGINAAGNFGRSVYRYKVE